MIPLGMIPLGMIPLGMIPLGMDPLGMISPVQLPKVSQDTLATYSGASESTDAPVAATMIRSS